MRYFLNAQQKLVRMEHLFKTVKNKIKTAGQVFDLLEALEKKADLFNAIKNPEDEFWNDFPQKLLIQKSLKELKLFDVSQPTPLLFSVFEKLPDIFHEVLEKTVVISFRYIVIAKKKPQRIRKGLQRYSPRCF